MRFKTWNSACIWRTAGLLAFYGLNVNAFAVTLIAPTTAKTTTTTTASGVTLIAPTTTATAPVTTTSGTTVTTGSTATKSSSTTTSSAQWSNYYKPFAANSLWNSRPINPVFGTFVIPTSSYYPAVSGGIYSTGVFLAAATDGPMTIYGLNGAAGVTDPDTQTVHTVTLPHWPASVIPAAGSDGHADIVDPVTGIMHSFWQLKQVGGKWQAQMYAWSPMNGTGWGDPAHFYQGARAAAVPASAGLIRAQEINDGLPTYQHALAMSLTYNALAKTTTYVYPATSSDTDAATQNSGMIPEGALVMLPSTYDTTKITSIPLRKVAETLKTYGAYVVDRNVGTPFVIYVENGTGYDLHNGGWIPAVATELDRIRANLRQVVSASSWVDGNGQTMSPQAPVTANTLSMRGPWTRTSGTTMGTFDSWSQTLQFPASATRTVVTNANSTGLSKVSWSPRAAGTTQLFAVTATGNATLRIAVYGGSKLVFDSGDMANGTSKRFVWPAGAWIILYATSGTTTASTVRADLTTVTP